MKAWIPLLFALFPFLHDQKYDVIYSSCEPDKIVVEKDQESFELQLFNLMITSEEGWQRTCSLLSEAKQIEIEIDSSTAIKEPLSAYVFVEGELLQKILIREEYAYTLIHNPEYTYESSLLQVAKSKQAMASSNIHKKEIQYASQGWKFLLFIFLSWSIMIAYSIYKNRHVIQSKD